MTSGFLILGNSDTNVYTDTHVNIGSKSFWSDGIWLVQAIGSSSKRGKND